MCAMSDPTNSRRIIQIGGPNAPRGNPVYSVPLQTTATINISLGGVGRTNAAGIGSGTKIRLNSRGAEMSNSSPRGILKGSGNQGSQAGIYGDGQRRSAAGTLATGEIVPQMAPIVQSSRSRYDAQVENAQLLHAADVHSVHSMSDQLDKASLNSTPYLMAADRRSTGSMGIQTEGQGNLSDTYNVIGSSTGTQVAPSDLGSLRKAPSESPYSHSNQSNTYGTSSEVGARSVGAGSGIYGGSNTGAGSGIYGSGSNTYATADEAAMVYSGIGSQNGDAVAEPIYSAGSTKSGGGASDNQVYAAQAAVVKSKRDSTATAKEGVYGSAGGGGGDEKIYGDDEGSWMDKEADPNSFRFIGWEVDSDQDENLPCKRVLVMKEPDMVLMFTASCQTEAAGNNKKLLDLMVDIADSCVNRLRVLITDVTSANIAASNMDSLPLSDGRHTKDHLEELSKELGETVAITDVAFRIQPPDGVYLGTFVQGTVVAKRNYAIGKVGVVAVLTKKSKFATVEAFSEQLCEHIARTKPANLGTMRGANTKHMTRRGMGKLQQQQRDQLLLQNFIFDQTIVVAEAARRSFCKIDGFLLFK